MKMANCISRELLKHIPLVDYYAGRMPDGFLTSRSDMALLLHNDDNDLMEGILSKLYLFLPDKSAEDEPLDANYQEAVAMLLNELERCHVSECFRLEHWIRDLLAVVYLMEDADLYSPYEQQYGQLTIASKGQLAALFLNQKCATQK